MKIKNIKLNKKFFAGLLMLPVMTFSSCGKSECDMVEYHLHKYEKGGFVRYIDDEHLEVDDFNWTDELVYVRESDRELYKTEKHEKLMKIDDNVDALIDASNGYNEYLEYEYKKRIKHTQKIGDTETYYYTTVYRWDTDPEHSHLTGNVRLNRYFYKSFNVSLNENGKYDLIDGVESENIEDIIASKDEYPYVKVDIAKAKIVAEGKMDSNGNTTFDNDEKLYGKK